MRALGFLGIWLASALSKGALIALYWNWFVRDQMFPTVPTVNVWLGIALASFGVLVTFQSVPDEDSQNQFGWVTAYTFLVYIVAALYAVILHAILA